MPSLDTTNTFLGVLAATAVIELLLVVGAIVWLVRLGSRLEHTLVSWEANHLGPLRARADAVLDDLHNAANQVQRVGHEMERTATRARSIVDVVGREVERTTDHARSAIDLVETALHQVKSVGVGIGNGLRMLLPFSRAKGPLESRRGNGPRAVDMDAL
jgi:hypothetical protein